MECFSDSEINLILTKLANSKQPSFYSENLQRHKITPYSYRQDLILKLKNLYNTYLSTMHNRLNIFYLGVLYLDIILSKNKLNISTEKSRFILAHTCFNLALKFIGIFEKKVPIIIRNNIVKYQKGYVICENKCLLLLNYNLIYSTIYDYIEMLIPNRTLYTNKKVLDLSKSILFSFIGNDCIMYYPPFLVAVAIIKFSKDNLSITKKEPYDKYFNKERINEIYAFIKKEYKLTKEIDDDNKNWDLKTMSSTVEEIKEIKEIKRNESLSNQGSLKYIPIKVNARSAMKSQVFTRTRNLSANNSIRRNLSYSSMNFNLATVNTINNKRDKINIDLEQMSKISFNKLAKLSIRYFKGQK